MLPIRQVNRYLAFVLLLIFGCVFALVVNPAPIHYIYAVVEAPSCTSRILEKLKANEVYDSVGKYVEANVIPGMTNKEVHETLENISPIAVHRYSNYEEIVLLMCEEPLNNLVYYAEYDKQNNLVNIEYEDFP